MKYQDQPRSTPNASRRWPKALTGVGIAVITVLVLLVDALTAHQRNAPRADELLEYGVIVSGAAVTILVLNRWWPTYMPLGFLVVGYICVRVASRGFDQYWGYGAAFAIATVIAIRSRYDDSKP